jgi:hypothetical protein
MKPNARAESSTSKSLMSSTPVRDLVILRVGIGADRAARSVEVEEQGFRPSIAKRSSVSSPVFVSTTVPVRCVSCSRTRPAVASSVGFTSEEVAVPRALMRWPTRDRVGVERRAVAAFLRDERVRPISTVNVAAREDNTVVRADHRAAAHGELIAVPRRHVADDAVELSRLGRCRPRARDPP